MEPCIRRKYMSRELGYYCEDKQEYVTRYVCDKCKKPPSRD